MSDAINSLAPVSIIVNSSEPLWEWDVLTDALFWSKGALEQLRLDNPPAHMSAYYDLLPPDAAEELAQARERAVSGDVGSSLECDYLCKGMRVHEIIIVMGRNAEGRATRVMGSFKVQPTTGSGVGFYQDSGHLADVGAWVFHVPSGRIWRDKACRTILGNDDPGVSLVSKETPLLDVHPAERSAIQRHYQLFCESPFLGDHITDIVRIQNGVGDYEPVMVRASAVERDESGRALLVAGIIASNDTSANRPHTPRDDRLIHALTSMGSGHWIWDGRTPELSLDEQFFQVLGYAPGEVKDKSVGKELVHPDDREKLFQARKKVVTSGANGDAYECTYRMKRADGEWAWMFERGCVSWRDQDDRAGQLFGSITNITTAQEERHKLEELVRTDSLTGVFSRAYCMLELEQFEQKGIRPVSVISIDITGLKMINDSMGHAGGDSLLARAAEILKKTLRQSDFIARTGGDEFLILFPGQGRSTAVKVRNKIMAALDAANRDEEKMPVLAACGIACADTLEVSVSEAIAEADEDMYRNKKMLKQQTRQKLAEWIFMKIGNYPPKDDRI